MTGTPGPRARRGSAARRTALRAASGSPTAAGAVGTVALLVATAGAVAVTVLGRPTALVAPAPHTRLGSAAAARVDAGLSGVSPRRAGQHVPPVEVAIPVIGVRSRLVGLHLNTDGTLQVPTDYSVPGWYADGAAPGDPGTPAIIVGHVDSRRGPGVFVALSALRVGDLIVVRRADGADVRFVVYASATYLKTRFPAATVYAAHRDPQLRLITCTGQFNRSTGHYTSNRVVFARLAGAGGGPVPGATSR